MCVCFIAYAQVVIGCLGKYDAEEQAIRRHYCYWKGFQLEI